MALTQREIEQASNDAFVLASQNMLPDFFPTEKRSFRYPMKRIDNTSDYLEIKIFDYIAGGIQLDSSGIQMPTVQQRQKAKKTSPTHYIILPVPQNVGDSNSVTWGEDTINPLEAAGLGFANETMQGKGLQETAQNAVEFLSRSSSAIANNPKLKNALMQYLGGQAVNGLGGNVSISGLIARTTGMIMNSNLELLFQAVNLRAFQFTFDLAPRFQKEAEEIKGIIRTLKKTMSARNGGSGTGNSSTGFFIDSPSVYQLTYKTGPEKHKFLNTFKPCALTDMSVNYTASGTYATYEDGSPVHLQMTLTFKELDPVYNEDYNLPEAYDGVGY